jgi:hypothetical protein
MLCSGESALSSSLRGGTRLNKGAEDWRLGSGWTQKNTLVLHQPFAGSGPSTRAMAAARRRHR